MPRLMTLLVALLAPAFAQAQICPDPVEVKVSDRLIAELIDWIDANSKYKISALPPARIQFCKSDVTFALDDAGIIVDPGLQSAYDPATQTIYMTAPWSPINPEMSSIILHNLVHHAQTQLAEWPCLRASSKRSGFRTAGSTTKDTARVSTGPKFLSTRIARSSRTTRARQAGSG